MKKANLSGRRFGRLIVIEEAERKRGTILWKCRCNCGNVVKIRSGSLLAGTTTSCGCYQKERLSVQTKQLKTRHGKHDSRVYQIWKNMRSRCYNKNDSRYHAYGAKGIKVHKRWWVFENFYNDMKDPPKNKTMDRLDNYGDYSPFNCKWASYSEQCQNKNSKGYTWSKKDKKWVAQIRVDGKHIYLGEFDDKDEAHDKYLEAKKYYFPNIDNRLPEYISRLHRCWGRLSGKR